MLSSSPALPRYSVTDREALTIVGLPAYLLGTWEHYATSADGWVRLARLSGRGAKFASLRVGELAKAVDVGLAQVVGGAS